VATNGNFEPLGYGGAVQLLRGIARKAGIKKRVHPHLFRHSRLTELAKAGIGESILKEFAGWTQRSEQPAIYVHLSGKNVDTALLRFNGIQSEETKEESKLKPQHCSRCRTTNAANSRYCSSCGAPLDVVAALDLDRKVHQALEVEEKVDATRLQEELQEIQEQLLRLRLVATVDADSVGPSWKHARKPMV